MKSMSSLLILLGAPNIPSSILISSSSLSTWHINHSHSATVTTTVSPPIYRTPSTVSPSHLSIILFVMGLEMHLQIRWEGRSRTKIAIDAANHLERERLRYDHEGYGGIIDYNEMLTLSSRSLKNIHTGCLLNLLLFGWGISNPPNTPCCSPANPPNCCSIISGVGAGLGVGGVEWTMGGVCWWMDAAELGRAIPRGENSDTSVIITMIFDLLGVYELTLTIISLLLHLFL